MAQPTVSVVSSCLSLLTGFCCTQSGRLPQESGTSSPAQDLIILLPVASIIARLTVWWLNRKIIRPQGNSRPGRISYSFFFFQFSQIKAVILKQVDQLKRPPRIFYVGKSEKKIVACLCAVFSQEIPQHQKIGRSKGPSKRWHSCIGTSIFSWKETKCEWIGRN